MQQLGTQETGNEASRQEKTRKNPVEPEEIWVHDEKWPSGGSKISHRAFDTFQVKIWMMRYGDKLWVGLFNWEAGDEHHDDSHESEKLGPLFEYRSNHHWRNLRFVHEICMLQQAFETRPQALHVEDPQRAGEREAQMC